jgi:hypothetical protein
MTEVDEGDEAVVRGLDWLVARQDNKNGSFAGELPNTYTALACIGLMAAGEQPGRTKRGGNLRQGLLFLVARTKRGNGYLGDDGGRMYGHAIATVALCEGYGMLAEPDENQAVGQAVQEALAVILKAQVRNRGSPHHGGWRYEVNSKDADLSVSAWQILALRAALNCGFEIPAETLALARDYVRGLHQGQGFSYQSGREPNPAMTAAGIVAMNALGATRDEADIAKLDTAARFLASADLSRGRFFYYQSYYLAAAASMTGEHAWRQRLPQLEAVILKLQNEDGQFRKHSGHDGGVYSTAFAVICLSMRYQYLPLYEPAH